MDGKVKRLALWWIVPLLPIAGFAAATGDLRLVSAVRNGDTKTVRSLLQERVDVNIPQGDGATALAWAVYRDDLETADLLIRAGANVNVANNYGATPLSLACFNGSAAAVEMLLKAGANPNGALPSGETPLMTAARTGNLDAVKLLLAKGAEVNAKETQRGQTALMWATAENHTEVVHALIEHRADVHTQSKGGFTPLLFAAQQGDLETARMLLAAGANVNEATPEDGTALMVASASGHEELALFLLDQGADPNAADRYGITALHYAIQKGLTLASRVVKNSNTESYLFRPNMRNLVKALLAHGANPNARIEKLPPIQIRLRTDVISVVGATPFLLAVASYDVELMRILLAAGANPHLATQENTTPLMFAAGLAAGIGRLNGGGAAMIASLREEQYRDGLEAVKLLVELGADVNEANKTGWSALHGAAFVGADAIAQFLVDHGARVDVKNDFGQTPLSIAENKYPPTLLDQALRPVYLHQSTAALLLKAGAVAEELPHDLK